MSDKEIHEIIKILKKAKELKSVSDISKELYEKNNIKLSSQKISSILRRISNKKEYFIGFFIISIRRNNRNFYFISPEGKTISVQNLKRIKRNL